MDQKVRLLLLACFLTPVAITTAALAQAPSGLDPQTIRQRVQDQKKPRQEVPIDPAILDNYVGDYEFKSYRVFKITKQADQQGAHLFIQLSGEEAVQLYPESTTKFFYKTIPDQISFVTDPAGRATELILHGGGLEQPAPRIDQAQAQQLEDAFDNRLKDETPLPGSEAALRRQIDAFVKGQPDFDSMTDELAALKRPVVSILERQFALAGQLQSISFLGVGAHGWDVYEAKFTKGIFICRIRMADAKVGDLLFEWGP
jgi:hypothetical protein